MVVFFSEMLHWTLSLPERSEESLYSPTAYNFVGKSAQSAIAPKSVKPYPPKNHLLPTTYPCRSIPLHTL